MELGVWRTVKEGGEGVADILRVADVMSADGRVGKWDCTYYDYGLRW